jgi:hypothetical protein
MGTNPVGLVLARVTLFQQDNLGEWFPVVGEAYWDELAPIRDEWVEKVESGKWEKSGRQILGTGAESGELSGGNWERMPRLMLQKCATMQALRAGWPEAFGGLHAEEEMDRARVLDLSASERVDREREERRVKAVAGKDAITVSFDDWTLENVPLGRFADRVVAWMEAPGRSQTDIVNWAEANRDALRTFWANSPADALELKRKIEAHSVTPINSVEAEPVHGHASTPAR